jgi:hypothetical protein
MPLIKLVNRYKASTGLKINYLLLKKRRTGYNRCDLLYKQSKIAI